ncbi:hypothetical protein Unana1_08311 [Umbelopsis nana]
MTKNELMESLQGEDYEIYTRKTSLDSALCVATEYKDTVKDVISDMVATIKEVVIKANLFAAFYLLDKLDTSPNAKLDKADMETAFATYIRTHPLGKVENVSNELQAGTSSFCSQFSKGCRKPRSRAVRDKDKRLHKV